MMKTSIDALEVAKFAEHAAHWWDTTGPLKTLHEMNPARMAFIRQFITFSDCSVLDVGCGGGILSEAMSALGAHVTGLDAEPEAIVAATAHAKSSSLPITYVCQPIETFESPPFVVVTCMEMLEHVPEPLFVLEQCRRLVRPGGYLFLSTINRTKEAYLGAIVAAEYVLGLLPRQTHDYEKFITPSELSAMVRAVGFDVVGLSGMSYHPFSGAASLSDSVAINYLLACQRQD